MDQRVRPTFLAKRETSTWWLVEMFVVIKSSVEESFKHFWVISRRSIEAESSRYHIFAWLSGGNVNAQFFENQLALDHKFDLVAREPTQFSGSKICLKSLSTPVVCDWSFTEVHAGCCWYHYPWGRAIWFRSGVAFYFNLMATRKRTGVLNRLQLVFLF